MSTGPDSRRIARYRFSAWLPPGIALGWLAVLATFVHGVGDLLTAWAATSALAILVSRRLRPPSHSTPATISNDLSASMSPAPGDAVESPTTAGQNVTVSSSVGEESIAGEAVTSGEAPPTGSLDAKLRPDPVPDVGREVERSSRDVTVEIDLHVLTAAEVASVLRVEADAVIAAINAAKLPGNRIDDQWRIDRDALVRWLQGEYTHAHQRHGVSKPTQG